MDVTNSFAVPFEEDSKNKDVWFLDHNYLENMVRIVWGGENGGGEGGLPFQNPRCILVMICDMHFGMIHI